MKKIFILSGVSGAGKSTLLNQLVGAGMCKGAIKYSERRKFNNTDDITAVENIENRELNCDLIYSMYGNRYGFSSEQLKTQLEEGNIILISNDKLTIEKMKDIFPKQVVVIYIVSDINKRLLRNIYMKRYGFPSIKQVEAALLVKVREAENVILQDNGEKFVQCLEELNHIVDEIFLLDEEFKLRVDSIKQQEELNFFTYDYTVLNLYSNSMSTVHATKLAFEQLKMIITKETEERYE